MYNYISVYSMSKNPHKLIAAKLLLTRLHGGCQRAYLDPFSSFDCQVNEMSRVYSQSIGENSGTCLYIVMVNSRCCNYT
jgi:hypothetical protein